jgi:hypothetical protein
VLLHLAVDYLFVFVLYSPDTIRPQKARVSITRGAATLQAPPSPIPAKGTPILSPAAHFKLGPAASSAAVATPPGGQLTAVVYLEE